MSFLDLFKIKSLRRKKVKNSMLLWEEDYLNIEILSSNNFDYIRNMMGLTTKIDANSSNDIEASQKSIIPTEQLNILKTELFELLESVCLAKYDRLTYYGIGKPSVIKDNKNSAFGSNKSAIFIYGKNDKVEHIWLASYAWKNISQTKIAQGLYAIGIKYDMILVDWIKDKIVDLRNESSIEDYLYKK